MLFKTLKNRECKTKTTCLGFAWNKYVLDNKRSLNDPEIKTISNVSNFDTEDIVEFCKCNQVKCIILIRK